MAINYYSEINKLIDWAFEELSNGSRIKASKINKVIGKMQERRLTYSLRKWR
jgi:hypothetical protein